jgi:hypothetical protein
MDDRRTRQGLVPPDPEAPTEPARPGEHPRPEPRAPEPYAQAPYAPASPHALPYAPGPHHAPALHHAPPPPAPTYAAAPPEAPPHAPALHNPAPAWPNASGTAHAPPPAAPALHNPLPPAWPNASATPDAPPPPATASPGTPHAQVPRAPLPRALALEAVTPRTSARVETLSRHFLGISLRRAFRLQIQTDEVLPSERMHLESQASHITDPDHQAFLAWRRSVLLLVAVMFVPLTVFRFIEAFAGPRVPTIGRVFVLLPAIAEAAFCVIAFEQLRNWAQWRRQRRVLAIAWAVYFVAPFLVYVYPFRAAFDSYSLAKTAAAIGGVPLVVQNREVMQLVVGLAFGVQALLALGPKVISLMPGLIRASIVTKLQFPGTTAPGWLMMAAAPFYALFAYIIVLLPYQITGSWQFVVGNFGILLAQVFIGLSGRRLTVPLSARESHERIHKSWLAYICILVVSAAFTVYGLYDFITQMHLGAVRVVTGVLAFVSNVLLDTLIGTDAIVSAMAYFRRRGQVDPVREQLLRESEAKIDAFCR